MTKILGLCLGTLLCATVSCTFTELGERVDRGAGPIPGVNVNVYATEADKNQGGLPN
jgi:hypothetical protein